MSTTSTSIWKVIEVAFSSAQQSLPEYSHKFSPRTFTQHQLFACLVLKSFLNTDYRGVAALLADCPSLAEAIDLHRVPHFTTLQKAVAGFCRESVSIDFWRPRSSRRWEEKKIKLAAIDSTGLQSHHCSSYFIKRRSRVPSLWQTTTYKRFPKVWIVCDTQSHLILEASPSRGPCSDVAKFKAPLKRASKPVSIAMIVADAGYDSESNHSYVRDELSIRSIIPPNAGRPTKGRKRGRRWKEKGTQLILDQQLSCVPLFFLLIFSCPIFNL